MRMREYLAGVTGSLVLLLIHVHVSADSISVLYPRSTETRDVQSLDGIWQFAVNPNGNPEQPIQEKWYQKNLKDVIDIIDMPVPASYNDITTDRSLRDHVGTVWYQRRFIVPASWKDQKVWIRFGSVCYAASVWVNGELATTHEIGHLPFQEEISSLVNYGKENVVTVSVDNTLLENTVPQGALNQLQIGNETKVIQSYTFDFFNYAGIDRSVFIYTTPKVFVSDLDVTVSLSDNNDRADLSYKITYEGNKTSALCSAKLIDRQGVIVSDKPSCADTLTVLQPQLWWPYLMDPDPAYLYTLQVEVSADDVRDVYNQTVGLRSITWTNTSVLINGKPIYIRGFGRHEDSDIRGKGLDLSLIVRDYNLIKWVGANTFRTSHYPYAEEIMDRADQHGIMIIDECPSVNTDIFSDSLLENHKQSLTELIRRDKNRPSVIMWSIANEPRTNQITSDAYFKAVADHVKSLEPSRPITFACDRGYNEDHAVKYVDVASFNKYYAWYQNTGRLDTITEYIVEDGENWHNKHNKPVLMTEYGADTMAGLHILPEYVWSEEFQTELMSQHFRAFDILRARGFFIGEMIWNFADFMTAQTTTRVGGNRKGIFTRSRQPKASAHLLRKRYWSLANELDNVSLPQDINQYVNNYNNIQHDEF